MKLFEGNLLDLLPAPQRGDSKPKQAGEPAKPRRAGPMRKPVATPLVLPKRLTRAGCHCGSCHTCLENARWERIFNEKFADPSYYEERGPHYSSPLAEASGLR
jgi:hypothetical protein